MKRLTEYKPSKNSNFPYRLKDEGLNTELDCIHKLGKLEDLEEEIGVNNLIAFLKWLVKFRNNFMCKSFDDMIIFYKRAMCETEKDVEQD